MGVGDAGFIIEFADVGGGAAVTRLALAAEIATLNGHSTKDAQLARNKYLPEIANEN